MSSSYRFVAALILIPAVVATLTAVPAAAVEKRPGRMVVLRAGPQGPLTTVAPSLKSSRAAVTARFKVTYTGFPPAAKKAFQRAVDIWARNVKSDVPITIEATYTSLDPDVLGSAGAGLLWNSFDGAPLDGTLYPDALANKLHGSQLDPAPDIVAEFNSDFPNWHFGAGPAPSGKYDFTSVVLHEICHGLGFAGAGSVSDGRGTVLTEGLPQIYDVFTENRKGRSMLKFADDSAELAKQLTGSNLFFDSPQVRAAHNSLPVKLYAPKVFDDGSTYSHLDEKTFLAGDPDSLMTPQLGMGETIRDPGDVVPAVFATFGW